MKLFETILDANRRAPVGSDRVRLPDGLSADALPVAVLTCIDSRLNALVPARLGIPEDRLVWLRNAGNIVTGPLSSTTRSLALACAVKGAKELAVVGHTDCQICKTTVLKLTDGLKALGIERHRLPENLVEYFALFASERQNVLRAVEIIRSSPLIGPLVSVHGLLLNIADGKLEWLVNGYESLGNTASVLTSALHRVEAAVQTAVGVLPDLGREDLKIGGADPDASKPRQSGLGGLELPRIRIGEVTMDPKSWLSQLRTVAPNPAEGTHDEAVVSKENDRQGVKSKPSPGSSPASLFDKARRYKVIGSDNKVYGPIAGLKILQWIAEGRIGWETPSQAEGTGEWRPLSMWATVARELVKQKLTPPRLPGSEKP